MKTAICPKCFKSLTEEMFVYRCANPCCAWAGTKISAAGAAAGGGGFRCSVCGEGFGSAFCPECGFAVKEDEPGEITLSLSLVGMYGSGKSHYLAVLIDELKTRFTKAFGCSLYPLGGDSTMSFYEKNYYTPLFFNGKCLPPTSQDDINPLLYSLVFPDGASQKSFGLALYDACGKNFESISAMSAQNRDVGRSGGVIFIIDPYDLPKLAEKYAFGGPKPPGADVAAVLARTIHVLRCAHGKQSTLKNLDVPIAVCLTKLDKIKGILGISSFLTAPSRQMRENSFDKYDFEACSLEAQSIIEAFGGREITSQILTQFNNYAFFGLSALGHEPDGGVVHNIVPHRVLDPVLWMFYKNKLIK